MIVLTCEVKARNYYFADSSFWKSKLWLEIWIQTTSREKFDLRVLTFELADIIWRPIWAMRQLSYPCRQLSFAGSSTVLSTLFGHLQSGFYAHVVFSLCQPRCTECSLSITCNMVNEKFNPICIRICCDQHSSFRELFMFLKNSFLIQIALWS